VAYSAAFGKSICADYETMRRRGTVLRINEELTRTCGGPQFVHVAWDAETHVDYDGNPTDSKIVNSNCLAKVGSAAFGDTYA
jgi:hypothetical protein